MRKIVVFKDDRTNSLEMVRAMQEQFPEQIALQSALVVETDLKPAAELLLEMPGAFEVGTVSVETVAKDAGLCARCGNHRRTKRSELCQSCTMKETWQKKKDQAEASLPHEAEERQIGEGERRRVAGKQRVQAKIDEGVERVVQAAKQNGTLGPGPGFGKNDFVGGFRARKVG